MGRGEQSWCPEIVDVIVDVDEESLFEVTVHPIRKSSTSTFVFGGGLLCMTMHVDRDVTLPLFALAKRTQM